MEQHKASGTATAAAAHREVECLKPKEKQIYSDPYAHAFLEPGITVIGKKRLPKKLALWLHEQAVPGVHNALMARDRWFDDYLGECLQNGLEQLVIFGAGYDTRAYRFEQFATHHIPVFEVDHPSTQSVKKTVITQLLGACPEHVVYVPLDFRQDDLAQQLPEHGYQSQKKTLFVWEGVSYYLPAKAVDDTLAFVREYARAGSSLVFDFFPPSVITGTSPLKEAKKLKALVESIHEPFIFGIEPAEIATFLGDRGFSQIVLADSATCTQQYCTGVNRNRYISPMFFFVHATVNP
jgi:methyltransferase (TIGR00027 family)